MTDDRAEHLRTLILGEINRRYAAIAPAHLHRKPQNQHAAAKARAHELNAMAAFVLTVRLPLTTLPSATNPASETISVWRP
jgi:hypothetical protein